ncbi:hypothetical protein Tco_0835287 [Tanacetum coccineum]
MANKKVVAQNITPKLQDSKRLLKGKDIQQDILSEYKINISYQHAWRGKDYGIQQIRGSPYESFEMLPYYCHNLERKNQRTVTHIKTDEKAIGALICTFLNYLRRLLIIDATHLKGLYKGTNLVDVGIDGKIRLCQLLLVYAKGKQSMHAAIAFAVHNKFPLAFHAVCCRHLMMSLSLKKKKTKGLFWKICKAYTLEDFASNMSILQAVQPDVYHKLCEAGPHRWSRAHCPLVRYNYMTSNSVKSVNACIVLNRKLPVLKLAETYHAMVQDWYYKRRELVDWFKKDIYQGTYAESIHFRGNMQQWEFLQNIQKAIPLRMDNPQLGRPKNTNRIQSQREDPRVIHYSRCKQAGHRRDQCNNPFVAEPPVNIRRRHDQKIPRNDQPSFYNLHQQYDNTFQSYNQYPSQ